MRTTSTLEVLRIKIWDRYGLRVTWFPHWYSKDKSNWGKRRYNKQVIFDMGKLSVLLERL